MVSWARCVHGRQVCAIGATLLVHILAIAMIADQLRFPLMTEVDRSPLRAALLPLEAFRQPETARPARPARPSGAQQAVNVKPALAAPIGALRASRRLVADAGVAGPIQSETGVSLPADQAGASLGAAQGAAEIAGPGPASPVIPAVPPAQNIGGDAHSAYVRALWRHLSKWRPSGRGLGGTAWIRLTVLADGRIGMLVLLRSSGNEQLDELALRAARAAQPLPRPTADLIGHAFDIPYRVGG